jgi:hypothetical protein
MANQKPASHGGLLARRAMRCLLPVVLSLALIAMGVAYAPSS